MRDQSGVAFIEFAMVLPLLLLIFMGLVDFARAFNERKRIVLVSSTIADIISQQSTTNSITMSTVDSVMNAASAIMTPYPLTDAIITVSAVQLTRNSDNSCCQAKVQWSVTRGGQLRPCNAILNQVPATVTPAPTNILAAMIDTSSLGAAAVGQLIVTDVKGRYQPMFNQLTSLFAGGFQRTSYRSPRGWGLVDLASTSTTTSNEQATICISH